MYLYIGALVFGGVLLGSSILLGGHDDADLDVDGDADLDLDLDADADADIDHGGHGKDLDFDGDIGIFWIFRSLRFWTFFLTFFGLTGAVLDGLGLIAVPLVTLALAIGMGALIGGTGATVIRKLMRDETGDAAHDGDYIGKSAKVVVPVKPGGVGKVRVELKGQLVDVLAITDGQEITSEDEVLIVEMEGTRAKIARVDD